MGLKKCTAKQTKMLCQWKSTLQNHSILLWLILSFLIFVGEIEAGLPEFKPPPFSTHGDNGTYVGFSDMIANVGSGVIIIPLISILESIAIASAFSGGKTIDATQVCIHA